MPCLACILVLLFSLFSVLSYAESKDDYRTEVEAFIKKTMPEVTIINEVRRDPPAGFGDSGFIAVVSGKDGKEEVLEIFKDSSMKLKVIEKNKSIAGLIDYSEEALNLPVDKIGLLLRNELKRGHVAGQPRSVRLLATPVMPASADLAMSEGEPAGYNIAVTAYGKAGESHVYYYRIDDENDKLSLKLVGFWSGSQIQ